MTPSPSPGCVLWTGYVDKNSYGKASGGRWAHRLAWEKANGPIPRGLWVLHRCDNPPCVNPDHLFLGTNQENQLDCGAKGRRPQSLLTHCKRGHSFADHGTVGRRKKANGRIGECRVCKACRRELQAKRNAERRTPSLREFP